MISNLRIVKDILERELPDYHFSVFNLLKFSRKENLKKYYIGKYFKYYNKPFIVKFKDGTFSTLYPKGITTLLEHEQEEDYYDLLNDIRCKLVSENSKYGANMCSDVISLEDKVKKIRWKEGL